MPTSSITKNFVVSGPEQVEKFVRALEESAKAPMPETEVHVTYLETKEDILAFVQRRRERREMRQARAKEGIDK